MPKGVYKRTKVDKPASEKKRHVETFTPVMVRDKSEIINNQARRIAELEGEIKRLRQLLHVAVNGTG